MPTQTAAGLGVTTEPFVLMARVTEPLANDHAPKITGQWVVDLRIAAEELLIVQRMLHPNVKAATLICDRLQSYADAIAAALDASRPSEERGME